MTNALRIAALIVAGLTAFPAAAVEDVRPRDAVDRGNARYAAGDYAAAADEYAAAARSLPGATAIRFNLGNAYYQRRLYAQALTHYEAALQIATPELEARLHYNLGNVKYQQALEAMNTLQDALTLTRAAMAYYRDSLALAPEQPDARYNLEMAFRLLREIRRQKVQPQANPRARDQKASSNAGQTFDQAARQTRPAEQGAEDNRQQDPTDGEATRAPNDNVTDNNVQTRQAATPRQISPDDAERMVEILRQRARAARAQRRQWRNARMRETRIERNW